MPFDSTQFDYTKVQPVYDRDNPPKRMSEAIRMAVADLEAVEKLPQYRIDMGAWHEPAPDGLCEVCFAGAVMARTHKLPQHRYSSGFDIAGWDWNCVFDALNELRKGGVASAAQSMGVKIPSFHKMDVTSYDENPEQFKADMLRTASFLEAEGS